MATDPDSTFHRENLSVVLRHSLRLAEKAGNEPDAIQREQLIHQCMACWRAAQRLRRWPGMGSRA
jgi:hypothetical protein